jgi:uncharacterized ferredoxin-like protein
MTDSEFYARIENYQTISSDIASGANLCLMIERDDTICCLTCEAVVIVSVKAAKAGRFRCGACGGMIDLDDPRPQE